MEQRLIFKPREPMWQPISSELTRQIVEGKFPAGSSLPNEAALTSEFGASRTVIRETIRVLTEKGLVIPKPGIGTLVQPSASWKNLDPDLLSARLQFGDGDTVIRELLVFRKGLEPVLVDAVAKNATENDLKEIQAAFDKLGEAKGDIPRYAKADADFHLAIVRASKNQLAVGLFEIMSGPIDLARERTIVKPKALETAHEQHIRIWAAIQAHDGDAAAAAIREHMEWNEKHFS